MRRIGDFLRAEMTRQKQAQTHIAIQIGLNPRTFRVRLQRDQFTKAETEYLIKLLKINATAEQLLERYAFDDGQFMAERVHQARHDGLGSVWSCIAAADQAAIRDEMRANDMMGLHLRIMQSMTPLGLHIISTQTVTPLEMEASSRGTDWRRALLCGIKQGGTFLYIRPSGEKLKQFNERWRFQRTIPMDEAKREFSGFRESLAEALVAEDGSGSGKKKAQHATRLISSRIAQIYCDEFPYFIPGFSLGLVHEANEKRKTTQRLTVHVMSGAAFAWVKHELHVFRYVSAAHIVIEENLKRLKQKQKLSDQEKAEESVCNHAFRLLNEHFGLHGSA